jgi:hypothetical protein
MTEDRVNELLADYDRSDPAGRRAIAAKLVWWLYETRGQYMALLEAVGRYHLRRVSEADQTAAAYREVLAAASIDGAGEVNP